MENNVNLQEKIDKYLLGRLSSAEMTAFEEVMYQDNELKESVDLQRMIIDEVRERASIYQIMRQAEEDGNTPKILFFRNWKVYSIAATILILITLVFWQPGKLSNKEIVTQYAMVVPAPDLKTSRGDGNEKTIEACPFSNLFPEECEIMKQALQFYDKEQYFKANELFIQVLNPPERNEELALFMAVSQFKIADYKNAMENFITLSQLSEFKYRNQVQYYLALTYIQNGSISKARKILKNLSKTSGELEEKANEVLKNLRWF